MVVVKVRRDGQGEGDDGRGEDQVSDEGGTYMGRNVWGWMTVFKVHGSYFVPSYCFQNVKRHKHQHVHHLAITIAVAITITIIQL